MSKSVASTKQLALQSQKPKVVNNSNSTQLLVKQQATELFMQYCKDTLQKQSNIKINKNKIIIKNKHMIFICTIVDENLINITIYQGIKKITESDKPDISINFNIKHTSIKNKIITLMNNIIISTPQIQILTNELIKLGLKKML